MATSNPRRYRILIADDHALLAEGLAALLRSHYDVVGIASDGRSMMAEAERLRPDIISLDIGMPELNGLDAARQIRRLMPRVKLIFVTQQIDLRYLKAALGAGANGFVAKQSASNELLVAIKQVLDGRRYITPPARRSFRRRSCQFRRRKDRLVSDRRGSRSADAEAARGAAVDRRRSHQQKHCDQVVDFD